MLQGPVLAWLNALEAMQEQKIDIPINLKVGKYDSRHV